MEPLYGYKLYEKSLSSADVAQEGIKYNDGVDFTTNSSLKLKGYIKIKNRELYIKFFIFLYFIILRDYHSHFLRTQEGRGQGRMVVATGPQ